MKRPAEVSIIGWLFIGVGVAGLAYQILRFPRDVWTLLISLVGVIAVVSGVFLLKGRNWARWLLLSWLAVHVVISAFHSVSDSLAHAVLLAVIAYVLLASAASVYFQPAK